MTTQEWNKFKAKFRKEFIATLTSPKYKFPPDSKPTALFKWMDVSIVFDGVMNEFKKPKGSK